MSDRTSLRSRALLTAILLGILADLLVRVSGRPGLSFALWAAIGVASLYMLSRDRGEPVSRESEMLVGGALLFTVLLVVRDADSLAAFSILAAIGLLTLAAGRAATAWLGNANVSDAVFAGARVALLCATGPIGWGRGEPVPAEPGRGGWQRQALTVVRGVAMALPVLLVLGALLMSADPVFARIVQDIFRIDIEPLIEHLLFIAILAWLSAGFLRAILVRDTALQAIPRVPQPGFAPAEISVALWVVNLLFILFMAVQLRYLFGGADIVQLTPDLSYADYARKGFFELILATALVVPVLLVADWAAAPGETRARSMLRSTMLVLILLLVGVITSAVYRMRLYQDAYGLTEQRLNASVFMAWITILLVWLGFTVLRGRREKFVAGAVAAAAVCVLALYAMNPHAVIARVNLDRAASGAEYDGDYITSLSADAVPTFLSRMSQLSEEERCRAGSELIRRWSGEREGGWRTWNLSDWRARRAVRGRIAELRCST